MGKTVSVYLNKKETDRLKSLIEKEGKNKKDAVGIILSERNLDLHKDHEYIIKLLEDVRSSPILQLGGKVPMVTAVQQIPVAERASWLSKIRNRLHRKQISGE